MKIIDRHHNLFSGITCLSVALYVPLGSMSIICGVAAGVNFGLWLALEIYRGRA